MREGDLHGLADLVAVAGPPPVLDELERRTTRRRAMRRVVAGSAMAMLLLAGVVTSAAVRQHPGDAVAGRPPAALPDPVPAGWALELDETTPGSAAPGPHLEILATAPAPVARPPFVAVATYPPSQAYGFPAVGGSTAEAGGRRVTVWADGSARRAAWRDADGTTHVVTGVGVDERLVLEVASGAAGGMAVIAAGDVVAGPGSERVYRRGEGVLSVRTTAADGLYLADLVLDRASGGEVAEVDLGDRAAVEVAEGAAGEKTSIIWLDEHGVHEVVGLGVARQLVLDLARALAR